MGTTTAVATQRVTTLALPGDVTIPEWRATDAKREVDRETMEAHAAMLKGAGKALAKGGEPVMAQNALHILNAFDVSGLVGTKDGQPWANGEQVAEAFGLTSKGYVSRLLRVGRAMAHHGVRVGSADFTLLCSSADAGLFSDILGKPEPVSKEAFKAGMTRARDLIAKNGGKVPSAEKVKAIESGKAPTREAQPDEGDKAKPEPVSKPVETAGDIIAVLHSLEAVLHGLDDVSATRVRKDLVRIASSDAARRKALAEKAAKAKAKAEPKGTPEPEQATTTPEPESTPES